MIVFIQLIILDIFFFNIIAVYFKLCIFNQSMFLISKISTNTNIIVGLTRGNLYTIFIKKIYLLTIYILFTMNIFFNIVNNINIINIELNSSIDLNYKKYKIQRYLTIILLPNVKIFKMHSFYNI